MGKIFCLHCGCVTDCAVSCRTRNMSVWGLRFDYKQNFAMCLECGEEVYVPELNDMNVRERAAAYRKAKQKEKVNA